MEGVARGARLLVAEVKAVGHIGRIGHEVGGNGGEKSEAPAGTEPRETITGVVARALVAGEGNTEQPVGAGGQMVNEDVIAARQILDSRAMSTVCAPKMSHSPL